MSKNIIGWILFWPFKLIAIIHKAMTQSISSKIIFSYLGMYVFISIVIDLMLVGVFGFRFIDDLRYDGYIYGREIHEQITREEQEDNQTLIGVDSILRGTGIRAVIVDSQNELLDSDNLTNTELILYNNFKDVKYKPFVERVSFYLNTFFRGGYYRQEITYKYMHIDLYHTINFEEIFNEVGLIGVVLLCGQFIGFFILWIFATIKTRTMLKPIKTMTKTTKVISASNLDVRLDVEKAQYELKDLARTINDMMGRIEDSYGRQQQFVSDVSHELRTPIAVVKGYADMLDRWGKEDPEVMQEAIDALRNESENMRLLVEKLLFLVRYDNETLKYEKKQTSLEDIVREVLVETQMLDKYHEIIADIDHNIDVFVDAVRIKEAIRIFVDNAIKYSPPSTSITISLTEDETYAYLGVKDCGSGISKENLSKIFNRFYRADIARTRDKGSHGLGLAIAKAIAFDHDGFIKVRSKLGEGSEFVLAMKKN